MLFRSTLARTIPGTWFFRARPVRWIEDPSGGWPGVVGTVAHSLLTRRGRGGPLGGTASTVRQSEGRSGPGVTLHAVRRQAVTAKRDVRYKIPSVLSPRHTARLHNPQVTLYLKHRPHKHPDRPQSPHFSVAKWPENDQNLKIASLRSMLREGADNLSARLCVASHSARIKNQRHCSHNNYLPLGVVFDLENKSLVCRLSWVLFGVVSLDHLQIGRASCRERV